MCVSTRCYVTWWIDPNVANEQRNKRITDLAWWANNRRQICMLWAWWMGRFRRLSGGGFMETFFVHESVVRWRESGKLKSFFFLKKEIIEKCKRKKCSLGNIRLLPQSHTHVLISNSTNVNILMHLLKSIYKYPHSI